MRLTRRADGAHYDQVTPGLQGQPPRRARRDRARPARQARAHAEIRARQFALYDDGLADLDRDRAARARQPRHARAAPLRRPHRPRTRRRRRATSTRRALADEQIATSIHFLPVHRLTWFRQPLPRAAAAAGRRAGGRGGAVAPALARALGGRHPRRRRRRAARPRPLHRMRRTTRIIGDDRPDGAGDRLRGLEDRPRADGRRPPRRRPVVVRARGRDHGRDRAADGAALEVAARGTGRPSRASRG